MPAVTVTVVIPTLAREPLWRECLEGLLRQSWKEVQVVVVDNGGAGKVKAELPVGVGVKVLEPGRNLGFGAAVNAGWAACPADLLAVINDDAVAEKQWVEALVEEMEKDEQVGMCAPAVLLEGGAGEQEVLDSAGMLVCGDGSSKQRGHGEPAERYRKAEDVLLASGAAAIYRGRMLDEIGVFDADYFLYCEDTDLGLRGAWAGWRCRYVPEAVVRHRYSRTAGKASGLKAYLVERNRLFTVVKNFPWNLLARAPGVSLARYFWHVAYLAGGKGKAAEYVASGGAGWRLPWYVGKAHGALARRLPRLWRERQAIRRRARLSAEEFTALVRRHGISAREVAAQ